ncbi:MAG: tRNA 2-thiouridine(34) synthase MnmA [Acidimicrobiales bacterium]
MNPPVGPPGAHPVTVDDRSGRPGRQRVLVAMSGGVDSSVAAALLLDQGHDVVGVTLKLWGGESDTGCCSVSDVDDARRVAHRLGIDHHVFNFADAFGREVIDRYVDEHVAGRTPNPCIECNRHIKFDALLRRADALGFTTLATGHHARVVTEGGIRWLARGADRAKDQSYVLHMLNQEQLARTWFPVGDLASKDEVRATAAELGLVTAAKPDSQDVCFIHSAVGRARFIGDRAPLRPGRVLNGDGTQVGRVSAVELVTVGQRRGLALGGGDQRRYVLDVDPVAATVTVGARADLLVAEQPVDDLAWAVDPVAGPVEIQCSAHGRAYPGRVVVDGDGGGPAVVRWAEPQRRVAAGQAVVIYRGDRVIGGAVAARR